MFQNDHRLLTIKDKEIRKTKIICLTPVRNEAWCLDVFIQCTSLWADYIIIADQDSKDGSKEIAQKYKKVILIENKEEEYNEQGRQELLINEARKIEGPRILIALDADEVFTANFQETDDWKCVLNSKPGDVFGFQWANITKDKKYCSISNFHFPWLFHDDNITKHKNYAKYIHSMRIPYPQSADKGYFKIKDFKVFHFAWIDPNRVDSKNRYYQCIIHLKEPKIHFISLFRSYNLKKEKTIPIPDIWLDSHEKAYDNLLEKLQISNSILWYDLKVIEMFQLYGSSKFKKLDIWSNNWIAKMKNTLEITDPRSKIVKITHLYLRMSQNYSNALPIKILDKSLKYIL